MLVRLTLVAIKYFGVSKCVHNWKIQNLVEKKFVEIFGSAKFIHLVNLVFTALSLNLRCHNCPDLQTFRYCIKN